MEFDILNELLTSSVAQLFTENQGRHQSMIKTSTQMGQDKNIPRQNSNSMLKVDLNSMQTPEKGFIGQQNSQGGGSQTSAGAKLKGDRPSPTGERLQQILSSGLGQEGNRSRDGSLGSQVSGISTIQGNNSNRQNTSFGGMSNQGSQNTSGMNLSSGYGSGGEGFNQKFGQAKTQAAGDESLEDAEAHTLNSGISKVSGSAGGIEDLKNWLKYESTKKFEESLKKLGLDNSKIQGKHLVAYSLDDLQNEKKRVKNELKIYDQEFMTRFKRAPNRSEKEPMRNLYMYYKRLKQYIDKREKLEGNTGSQQTQNSSVQLTTEGNNDNQAQPSSNGGVMQQISSSNQQKALSVNNGSDKLISGASDSDAGKLVVNLTISEREAIIKQNGFRTGNDVNKKLNEIKNERKELRNQLDQFQKNFEDTHKRKIRYTKDIVPVQAEFKRYKDLKLEIARLEQVQKYFVTK